MCPQERLSRPRGSTKTEILGRHVRCVPDLFRDQAHALREIFQRMQIRFRVTARGNLVMSPLPRQQGPGAACAPFFVRAAIVALAVTVVVVATPTRTRGCFDLQYSFDDA